MRRTRRRNLPPNPKILTELEELPEDFKKTLIGEKFLIFDSKDKNNDRDGRVLVFSMRKNLEFLSQLNEELEYLKLIGYNINL